MIFGTLKRKLRDLFDGGLELFGGPTVSGQMAQCLRAEQIYNITRYTLAMMAGNIFNAVIIIVAFWSTPQRASVLLWGFPLITFSVFIYLKRRAAKSRRRRKTAPERLIFRAVINAFVLGCLWACLPLFFFIDAPAAGRIIIITVTIGMLCAGSFVLAPIPIAGLAYLLPLVLAGGATLVRAGEPVYLLIIGLLIVYSVVLTRAMSVYASQFLERFVSETEKESAAHSDTLTKIPNRALFDKTLDDAVARAKRVGENFAVFFIDLDKFKNINDDFGHSGGDEFLIQVAGRLQMCVREIDLAARIGGDEFAIIAANIDDPESVSIIAERVLRAFDAPFQIQEQQVYGACSMGITLVPIDGTSAEEIMCKADDALYNAKREKPGSYKYFEPAHEARTLEIRELEKSLREALKKNEFYLVYQPIVDISTGTTTGFETLLRWTHPNKGNIPPSEFIKLAEKAGLIHEIGEWVICGAITTAAKWPTPLRVAINVSAVQFRTTEIASAIEKAINLSGISPDRIELEITETMILRDVERAQFAIMKLRNLGVKIALDDFGTGYSSLTHLINLSIDRIKIDRSFVERIFESKECETLVRTITRLAEELNVGVTAEGVETKEQLDYLKSISCDEAQGYFISRPLATDSVDDFISDCLPDVSNAA